MSLPIPKINEIKDRWPATKKAFIKIIADEKFESSSFLPSRKQQLDTDIKSWEIVNGQIG
jgi:hypothetical protein